MKYTKTKNTEIEKSEIPFNERKLSGRRHPASKKTNGTSKVLTFRRQYGKETSSFDAWFRSDYSE